MTGAAPLRVAALLGMMAVLLGAFGAHSLKPVLLRNQTAAIWETAVFYHLIHAVVLFVLAGRLPLRRGPWFCFLFGIVVFSGSLYLLALTNQRWLGAVTPVGGISLVGGWLWLALAPGHPRATP